MEPRFFSTPASFEAWLASHHETAVELIVGFWKKGSARPSITWPESVECALCFGWIDGVRRSLGDEAYSIRFTPRRPTSIWSKVNVGKVAELQAAGRMRPAGLRAFAARSDARTAVYSFERADAAALSPEEEATFRDDPRVGAFFDAQAPGYRRTALHWVVSAKRPETRAKRLATLKRDCAEGRTLAHLTRVTGRPSATKTAKKEKEKEKETPKESLDSEALPKNAHAKKRKAVARVASTSSR